MTPILCLMHRRKISRHSRWVTACAASIVLSVVSLATIQAQTAAEPANNELVNTDNPAANKPASDTDKSLLTVERIFDGGEFSPANFNGKWDNSRAEYVMTEEAAGGGHDIVSYRPGDGSRQILVSSDRLVPAGKDHPLGSSQFEFSADRNFLLVFTNSVRVWRQHTRGDYWILDRGSQQLRKVGGDFPPASLMFAKFSPAGDYISYVHNNDIYVESTRDAVVRRLTTSESPDIIHGTFDWVYEEEFSLRDGTRWSPDGKKIAFWQIDSTDVPEMTLLNNTDTIYPEAQRFKYPKVGQTNPRCRIGILDIDTGETTWAHLPESPADFYIARMDWAGNSSQLVLQHFNRLQNTAQLLLVNAEQGVTESILTEHDDAWLDVCDEMFWFDNGQHFSWISERDGWRHIYIGSRDGTPLRQVTHGAFDVIQLVSIDERAEVCYYLASPENSTQSYLYQVGIDGSNNRRLTPTTTPGSHQYQFSSDHAWAFHTHSTFTTPPRTELIRIPNHETVKTLVDNAELAKKLGELRLGEVSFLQVPIGDDVTLDGWQIRPPQLMADKRYPLVVHVYGEPAGQTVVDRWSGGNYLWHHLLAQQGYVVMSFDNRGTPAPKGRQWRKCVYRQIGLLASADQANAVKSVLSSHPELDPARVAIWGWSGGGSMTLNGMFRYPDIYKAGISIAPVPNQRYYDTIYQERYMGLPGDNADGYLQGSPIHFAHQLQGELLLVHGTGDDNCHYQTTEMLINELVRLKKPFSMMAYPNRSHAIQEGNGTTVHLRNLMTRFLTEHVPPGAK